MKHTSIRKKIIFVGDSNSGKTSSIYTFKDNKQNIEPTIGVNFFSFRSNNIYYDIWDTSGNKKFTDIINIYFQNVDSVFLFVNIDKNTEKINNDVEKFYKNIKKQLKQKNSHKPNCKLFLVINKCINLPNYKLKIIKDKIGGKFHNVFHNILFINCIDFNSVFCLFTDYILELGKNNIEDDYEPITVRKNICCKLL